MSTTASSYLNNVGPKDPEYNLAQQILSNITVAASTVNAAAANRAKADLPNLFSQFVSTLIANGRFSASTVLALVASATASGNKTLTDVGVLGNVAVSGSTIAITAGAY